MPELVQRLASVAVSAAVTDARPSAAGDGASCLGWRSGGFGPGRVAISLDGAGTTTVASPTGGAEGPELWGQTPDLEWKRVATLNGGVTIPITGAGQGWATTIDLGVPYDRLQVAGVRGGGTAVTATFDPVEVLR